MKMFLPLVLVLAASGVATIPAGSATAQGAQPQAAPAIDPAAGRKPTRFVEQGLEQLSSPFTKPTVIKLNAIVARSKNSIDTFDHIVPGIRASVAAAAKPKASLAARKAAHAQMGKLMALATKARTEQTAMKAAEKQVRASGEKYNDTILSAMVGFVDEVKTEIDEEVTQLSAKLA
ncbi:MAG: hypothetical protein ACKVOB_03440 [Sphingomonas sp.]